jgi:hypothetical protein
MMLIITKNEGYVFNDTEADPLDKASVEAVNEFCSKMAYNTDTDGGHQYRKAKDALKMWAVFHSVDTVLYVIGDQIRFYFI